LVATTLNRYDVPLVSPVTFRLVDAAPAGAVTDGVVAPLAKARTV
jgi:hypothetical protein